MTKFYFDYLSQPIGNGNPYHACAHCGISAPAINGTLEGHLRSCEWRMHKEQELDLERIISLRESLPPITKRKGRRL